MRARLVTAVALYGPKTGPLRVLLETVQDLVGRRLGECFRPYTLDQIHGTVIRFDGALDPRGRVIVNERYRQFTGLARPMDHALALDILTDSLTPPMGIRLGGYGPGTPAAFSSRGQPPHERMFSAQGDAFVLVGWPVTTIVDATAPRRLDDLRRKMNDANVLHWYHRSWTDVDDDFHLVVGHHDGATARETSDAVSAVRAYLERHPVEVEVGAGELAVIASDSPTLAPARFVGRLPVDPAAIADLYR